MGARSDQNAPRLNADLAVFSASDALQWARSSKLTGSLVFRREGGHISLLFDQGRLIYAEARDPQAAFGRHLYAEGLVDEVDLAAATVYGRDNQKRLGAVMVELGILPKSEIKPELHQHTLNLASMPLAWTDGSVEGVKSEAEIMPVVLTDPVDPTHLLMEAARRVDETRAMRQFLPDDSTRIAPGPNELPNDASSRAKRVVETLGTGTTLGELYSDIGGSHFQFLDSVHELVEQGVLEASVDRELADSASLRQTG